MNRIAKFTIIMAVTCLFLWSSAAVAFELLYEKDGKKYYRGNSGKTIVAEKMGVSVPNPPDYAWWYGCSPTSAGMMMGYYDRCQDIGGNYIYPNLVPGGVAELSTYPTGAPAGTYLVQAAIASNRHISDYYTGYGNSGDDPVPGGSGPPDCLADFMGSNQDNAGNADGSTTFWNYVDGSPMTPQDIVDEGIPIAESGMYGIKEYIEFCGYNYDVLYNQYINPFSPAGFTYGQFQTEIDNCRPQMLHIIGHTMFARGYTAAPWPQTVYVHDTWAPGPHTMQWGALYPPVTGEEHKFMTIVVLQGITPTVVQLASFSAVGRDGYVDVEWVTATELSNAGFNVYRSSREDGEKTQLNDELIPAKGDELQGATYSHRDYDVAGGGPYCYWFEDVGLDGNKHMSNPVKVDRLGTPRSFSLAQNTPNPFNPNTMIKYNLAEDCHVKLEVFNTLGQRVATLVDEHQMAGSKVVNWRADMKVSSGTYFYRLQAGSFVEAKKMVILK